MVKASLLPGRVGKDTERRVASGAGYWGGGERWWVGIEKEEGGMSVQLLGCNKTAGEARLGCKLGERV